jgi:hypothetical protein
MLYWCVGGAQTLCNQQQRNNQQIAADSYI